jgi:hypothetical protein
MVSYFLFPELNMGFWIVIMIYGVGSDIKREIKKGRCV